jgi:esterase/lipase superfamily enzyme
MPFIPMAVHPSPGHNAPMHIARLTLLRLVLAGCGVPQASLMVTPLIYHEGGIDPLAHVDASHRTLSHDVFFATNRARAVGQFDDPRAYSNTPTETLQLGMARVQFGDTLTWDELHHATRTGERTDEIALRLTDVWEHGSVAFQGLDHAPSPTDGSAAFFRAINAQLAVATQPEIIIYVHGAKVNFYNACMYAAELNHFAGRDMVALAFAWPTHQDIFQYLSGADVERGRNSVRPFESLLCMLAQNTVAERINIVCWSAGGRVVSRALEDLSHWEDRLHEDPAACRIGTVIFAAPDVPVHDFVERLPESDRVAGRVIITASDDDTALKLASNLMDGGVRMGTIAETMPAEEVEALAGTTRVELLNVSSGQAERGFDIRGHRYWFSHPWVASDLVLALRTGLPADQRGLSPTSIDHVWYFPSDYPRRVRAAAHEALDGTW